MVMVGEGNRVVTQHKLGDHDQAEAEAEAEVIVGAHVKSIVDKVAVKVVSAAAKLAPNTGVSLVASLYQNEW